MSDSNEEVIYEALTRICSTFSLRPQYHHDRLLFLTYPQGQWVDLSEVLTPQTLLAKQLTGLTQRGVDLQAIHFDTPDGNWSLVNFYCQLIDAMPATVLWLKQAHTGITMH